MDCSLPASSGKNTGMGCHSLLQWIFLTQGSNPFLFSFFWIKANTIASQSEVAQSCLTLCDPWTVAHQAPPSMGFSRQEYWSGLPFPSPGDLPNPGIESRFPALQADALTSEPPGKQPKTYLKHTFKSILENNTENFHLS